MTDSSVPDSGAVSDPSVDPSTATQTEREIAAAQARLDALLARKQAEDAARAVATHAQRELAVHLHQRLCHDDHGNGQCTWVLLGGFEPDNPDMADWTEAQHSWWLGVALAGVDTLLALRWTVQEPPSA